MRVFVMAAFIIMFANLAWADTRDEAIRAIATLKKTATSQVIPDEMLSVDATFLLAEQYFQNNDHEKSNRYYILTIQKVRVFMANLPDHGPGKANAPATNQLPSDSYPSFSTETSEKLPPPMPAPATSDSTHTRSSSPANSQPHAEPQIDANSQSGTDQSETETDLEYIPDEAEKLVGNSNTYTVREKDSLRLVAAKLGVSRQHLVRLNHLDPKKFLKVGQKLKYNNCKIVPQRMKNGIVINIPDRTLYYFRLGKLAVSMPVALGAAKKANKSDKYDWETPTGKFKIVAKQKDPTWYVPRSIQTEMEDLGKEVITSIPPGPENPLGKYAIKTSLPGIMIHSTTKPGSVYSFASHGCIRVNPEQMEEFYKEIKVNTPGEIIYRPVKLAVTEQGRIFLEVHQDTYRKSAGLETEAKQLIEKRNLSDRVDWEKVNSVIKQMEGIAEDITL